MKTLRARSVLFSLALTLRPFLLCNLPSHAALGGHSGNQPNQLTAQAQ